MFANLRHSSKHRRNVLNVGLLGSTA